MTDDPPGVLVVEDDPQINELVGAYVELAGFRPDSVMTGEDALQKIRSHAPALILLDLMLPDVDGLEICRRLHRDPGCSRIPIVIISALDRDECRREARENGAVEYLTKPFDPDRLIDVIKKWATKSPAA